MSPFLRFVEFLVAISVVVAAVSNYLIINKLWSRRDRKEVAESISISAALLGLATGVPFLIQFLVIDQSPAPAIKQAIGLVTAFVFISIGSGLWVSEYRGQGFMRLLAKALKLEGHESRDLIKSILQPKGAAAILSILHKLATIDRHLHEKEIELIEEFAARWKIAAPPLEPGDVDGSGDLLDLRQSVAEYLKIGPPPDQAAQLLDVMHLFVKADAQVSPEEELALEELSGLIEHYVAGDGAESPIHEVLIVPQSDEQMEAVRVLIPGTEMKVLRGGRVFSVCRVFSANYAEVICEKYIALGLFTTQVRS